MLLFNILHKGLGWLECRNIMFGNDDGCVLGYVTGRLLCTLFQDETTEAPEVDVLIVGERVLDRSHEGLDGTEYRGLVNARFLGNGVDDVCFSHLSLMFVC